MIQELINKILNIAYIAFVIITIAFVSAGVIIVAQKYLGKSDLKELVYMFVAYTTSGVLFMLWLRFDINIRHRRKLAKKTYFV